MTIYKLKLLSIGLVLLLSTLILTFPSTSYADGTCPGSAAPSGTNCATIPFGCPGTSQQGPAIPKSTFTCPWSPTDPGWTCAYTTCTFQDSNISVSQGDSYPVDLQGFNTPDHAASASTTACSKDSKCKSIFTDYLIPAVNLLSALVGVIVVAVIIFSGIQFSASGGSPEAVASAKKHLQSAVIALVAFIFLWAFLNFIIPGGVFNGNPADI